jgi:hypothetical protein
LTDVLLPLMLLIEFFSLSTEPFVMLLSWGLLRAPVSEALDATLMTAGVVAPGTTALGGNRADGFPGGGVGSRAGPPERISVAQLSFVLRPSSQSSWQTGLTMPRASAGILITDCSFCVEVSGVSGFRGFIMKTNEESREQRATTSAE